VPLTRELSALMLKVRSYVALRRDARVVAGALRRQPKVPTGSVEAVVFFADGVVNAYQLRQWYEPMRRLAEEHPVVVVTRRPDATRLLLDECPLPVLQMDTVADLESWLTDQEVAVFFYVNQNQANFAALRFADPAHVFVSHGESEKAYMVSNQLKAYDAVFVAGPAAVRRIEQHVVGLPTSRLVPIGRPQVDVAEPAPTLASDDRIVVLYAPTWEGDRPSMAYSSLLSHGREIVDRVVSDDRYRLVYRPHPRTGVQDGLYRTAHTAIVHAIEAANAADSRAQHLVDVDTAFGWQLTAADACIADVSAVAYDWLATGKPLILTRPADPAATMADVGLATRMPTLADNESTRVVEILDGLLAAPDPAYAALVEDYFGDTSPGASMRRFLTASAELIGERQARRAVDATVVRDEVG